MLDGGHEVAAAGPEAAAHFRLYSLGFETARPRAAVSPPGRKGRGLWFCCLRGLNRQISAETAAVSPACSIRIPFLRCPL